MTREDIKRDTIECNVGCTMEELYDDAWSDGYNAAQSKWIAVKDKLPEPYEEVLVLIGDIVDFAHIDSDDVWHTRYVSRIPVICWMPIPGSPETK